MEYLFRQAPLERGYTFAACHLKLVPYTMIDLFARWPFHINLLTAPGIGRLLRWKHTRTLWRGILFTLAAIMIIDGFFGSPLAAKNTATVAAWVH